jgi:1,2-diacylglycerol 3-alpha-glucosyltransferase
MAVSRPKVPKVLLLAASNLGPYHQARYSELSRCAIDLVVAKTPIPEFYRPWSKDAAAGEFRAISPFGNDPAILASPGRLLRRARRLLHRERPDVVVCTGYNNRCAWTVSLLCRAFKIPCVLYIVGWEGERARDSRKELAKKIYCHGAFTAAMATGVRARDYARTLGIPSQKIWCVGNVVDNAHFAQAHASANAQPSPRLAGLPAEFFVTVARLSPEKNLGGLLEAFAHYRQNGGTWDLCIAGTGPQEEELKAQTPAALAEHVHWLGWVSYNDLPELYQRAGCFVIPSHIEPWGLVVNEAMAAGRPVLVSEQCGCQPELCREGENGFSFDPGDTVQLAQLMATMSGLPAESRAAMGDASRRIVARFTLETWRQAFVDCVTAVAAGRDNAGRDNAGRDNQGES